MIRAVVTKMEVITHHGASPGPGSMRAVYAHCRGLHPSARLPSWPLSQAAWESHSALVGRGLKSLDEDLGTSCYLLSLGSLGNARRPAFSGTAFKWGNLSRCSQGRQLQEIWQGRLLALLSAGMSLTVASDELEGKELRKGGRDPLCYHQPRWKRHRGGEPGPPKLQKSNVLGEILA